MAKRKTQAHILGIKLELLMKRTQCTCEYCQEDITERSNLTLDHVVPLSKGGSNEVDNILISCTECNLKKDDLLLTDFILKYNIKITKRLAEFL